LPDFVGLPLIQRANWSAIPENQDWVEANNLQANILEMKKKGLQREQITRHFIKNRLAPIKERSKPAFEYEGESDPNREDHDALSYRALCTRMYKIFSSGIIVDRSHKMPCAHILQYISKTLLAGKRSYYFQAIQGVP
jgi:hypothetical protein